MQYPYVLTDTSLTVYIDGSPYHCDRNNSNWDEIKKLINKPVVNAQNLIDLIAPKNSILEATKDVRELSFRNGYVFYGEERIHDDLAKRLIDIKQQGISLDPWVKFVRNCFANPLPLAKQELYDWLEKAQLPITSDGCFLAYKVVRSDYKDYHSGKFDNSVGKVCEMPRDKVNPNRSVECGTGLHFAAQAYLPQFHGNDVNSRVMVVKINPADVVSIPNDYNRSKGRTCRYEVVEEVPASKKKEVVNGAKQWDKPVVDPQKQPYSFVTTKTF